MVDLPEDDLADAFLSGRRFGATPVSRGVALPHLRHDEVDVPALVCVRCRSGVDVAGNGVDEGPEAEWPVYAFFFSVSPRLHPGRHLQMLAHLARRVDEPGFMEEWLAAESPQAVKETSSTTSDTERCTWNRELLTKE